MARQDALPAPVRSFPVLVAQELAPALRRLLRDPAFFASAVLTLALGFGAVLGAYAVLQTVVLDPLPYPHADRLVRIHTLVPGMGEGTRWGLAKGQYLQLGKRTASFEALGLYQLSRGTLEPVDGGEARSIAIANVSSDFFRTLGVELAVGRLPEPADHLPEKALVGWLSYDLWQDSFGGDPAVLGKILPVDGRPVEVAGVLARGTGLPEEAILPDLDIRLWTPLWLDPGQPAAPSHVFRAVGLLQPGVDPATATRELDRLIKDLPRSLPEAYSEKFLAKTRMASQVVPLRDDVLGENVSRSLWIVFASVLLVLAIGVGNVVNLFLARSEASRRESTIRLALGASRARLLAVFTADALLVTAASALLGLPLAQALLGLIRRSAPADLPRLNELAIGAPVYAGALVLALAVAFLLGLVPAALGHRAQESLGAGSRQSSSRGFRRFRHALVVVQLALSVLLLVGASLLYQSFRSLLSTEPGFQPAGVLTFLVSLPGDHYSSYEQTLAFYQALARGLEDSNQITKAAMAMALPLDGFDGCSSIYPGDRPLETGEEAPCVPLMMVSPGYFTALGIPVEGRLPDWAGAQGRLGQVVVSRALAARLWPGADPLGRSVRLNPKLEPMTVSGVAADVRAGGLDQPATAAAYLPMAPPAGAEWWPPLTSFYVAASTRSENPRALVSAVRAVVAGLDPRVPLREVRSMEEIVGSSISRVTLLMKLLGAASAIALVLSFVGIYGSLTYLMQRRRRELGIRLALGASPEMMLRMVIAESLRLAAAGVLLGTAVAFLGARTLESLLFGITPGDPRTLLAAAAFLIATAIAASWLPAWRASRLPPGEILRQE